MLKSRKLITHVLWSRWSTSCTIVRDMNLMEKISRDFAIVFARQAGRRGGVPPHRRPTKAAPSSSASGESSNGSDEPDKDADKEKKRKEFVKMLERFKAGNVTSRDMEKLSQYVKSSEETMDALESKRVVDCLNKAQQGKATPEDMKIIRDGMKKRFKDMPLIKRISLFIFDKLIDSEGTYKKADISKMTEANREKESEKKANSSEGNEENGNKKEMINRMKKIGAISLFIYGLLILLQGPDANKNNNISDCSWSEFKSKLLPTGQGSKGMDGIPLEPTYRLQIPSLARFEGEVRSIEDAVGLPPEHWTQIEFKRLEGINNLLVTGVLVAIGIGIYFLVKKSNFKMSAQNFTPFSKSKINIIDPNAVDGKSKLKIKFKDVAGLHEAKIEVNEFVDYLKNPQKYTQLGAKLPKGALLTGPPGCGKTLLAKALAAESSAPFISMNGTEFIEMIGGLGASRIRDLFKEAKRRAPCIVYIDEIDAIGRKRSEGTGDFGGGNGEEEQTLNQLLVEMDGMDTNQGVILIASTNRPDILDRALMRPGRFDRHISVDLPTLIERRELFDLYIKQIKLNRQRPEHLTQRLAQMTPGFSGADIANVCNEAAIHAATDLHTQVEVNDLDFALQKIIAGPEKRSKVLVQEEREVVAWHESGHALVGWLLEHTDALLKVTIIPRTSAALGFAQYNPRDKKLYSKQELFDRMCMMLGGRAAENITFGRCTTGAQNDLEKVTQQAYAQIKRYGFSKVVGPLSFASEPGQERSEQFQRKPYSKQFGNLLDSEARELVKQAYSTTEKLLNDNRDKLDLLAKTLLKMETMSYEDVKKLIGPPTYGEKNVVDLADMILPKDED